MILGFFVRCYTDFKTLWVKNITQNWEMYCNVIKLALYKRDSYKNKYKCEIQRSKMQEMFFMVIKQ